MTTTELAATAAGEAQYLFDMALKIEDEYGQISGLDPRYSELDRAGLLAAATVQASLANYYATISATELSR